MRIEASPNAQDCRIRAEGLDCSLDIQGVDAHAMEQILAGRGHHVDWCQRQREVVADTLPPTPRAANQTFEHDFDDGRVELKTGQPGRLIVRPKHRQPEYLLPQSLNLLLAQQWARTGHIALHAAAIQTDQHGILLLGARGAGKSILTMAALNAGARVVSDDWVLLGVDEQQKIRVERLRQFLMLRRGWAGDSLQAISTNLPFRPNGKRPKSILAVPSQDARFPSGCQIDQIWLLQRPSGARGTYSTAKPTSSATTLLRLLEAGMPLLFSKSFPHEHQALLGTARRLIRATTAQTVETGTDLIENPAKTLRALAAS